MPYVSGLGISRRATNWGADGSYTYIYMYISKIRSDVTVFRERGAVMFDLRWSVGNQPDGGRRDPDC